MLRDAAGHPDHDARVALPDAHLAGARDAARRRDADPRRGARGRRHEARRAPRALARAARAARRASRSSASALSATQRPLEEIGRFVSGGRADRSSSTPASRRSSTSRSSSRSRTCASSRRPAAVASAPADGRRWTSAPSARELDLAVDLSGAARARPRSTARRSSSSTTAASPSGSRCGSTSSPRRRSRARTTARSRASSASQIEEDLKAGRIPCLVATSSLELGIDMGAVDLVDPGRVAEVGRARPAAHRPRRPRRSARSRRGASSRSSAPTCSSRAVVAQRMREGAIEETQIPRNPLDVLAQQIVAICADEEIAVDELHALVRARVSVRRALARAARERARHARGPLPVRRVRRAAAAHHLGPHRGRRARARGRAPARGHERGHDPRPRPLRRLPRRRRRPRRRARRGDGLRGARRARCSCSARRRGGSRRSRATACSSRRRRACPGAVPFWKGEGVGRPYELGEAIGEFSRELRRAAEAKALERLVDDVGLDAFAAREPARRSCSEQERGDGRRPVRPHRRRRALPRRDRRLARLHPHAVRRARARAVGDGGRRAAARLARDRGAVDLVGRRHRVPPARRRRAARDRPAAAHAGRARRARRSRRWGRPRSSARASARTRRARC